MCITAIDDEPSDISHFELGDNQISGTNAFRKHAPLHTFFGVPFCFLFHQYSLLLGRGMMALIFLVSHWGLFLGLPMLLYLATSCWLLLSQSQNIIHNHTRGCLTIGHPTFSSGFRHPFLPVSIRVYAGEAPVSRTPWGHRSWRRWWGCHRPCIRWRPCRKAPGTSGEMALRWEMGLIKSTV